MWRALQHTARLRGRLDSHADAARGPLCPLTPQPLCPLTPQPAGIYTTTPQQLEEASQYVAAKQAALKATVHTECEPLKEYYTAEVRVQVSGSACGGGPAAPAPCSPYSTTRHPSRCRTACTPAGVDQGLTR
jgi:hypothetical protein